MRPKWKYKEPHYSDYMLGELKLAYIQENSGKHLAVLTFRNTRDQAAFNTMDEARDWIETQTHKFIKGIEI